MHLPHEELGSWKWTTSLIKKTQNPILHTLSHLLLFSHAEISFENGLFLLLLGLTHLNTWESKLYCDATISMQALTDTSRLPCLNLIPSPSSSQWWELHLPVAKVKIFEMTLNSYHSCMPHIHPSWNHVCSTFKAWQESSHLSLYPILLFWSGALFSLTLITTTLPDSVLHNLHPQCIN